MTLAADYVGTIRLADFLPFGLPERVPKQTAMRSSATVPPEDDCGPVLSDHLTHIRGTTGTVR